MKIKIKNKKFNIPKKDLVSLLERYEAKINPIGFTITNNKGHITETLKEMYITRTEDR